MVDHTRGMKTGPESPAEGTRDVPLYSPAADIYETKDALVLLLEIPGIPGDGVNITLDKHVLTVVGRCKPNPPEGYALAHSEYRDGDYERSFTLSEAIDGDAIEATMKDGVLRLTLPKTGPAPAKTISVKTG